VGESEVGGQIAREAALQHPRLRQVGWIVVLHRSKMLVDARENAWALDARRHRVLLPKHVAAMLARQPVVQQTRRARPRGREVRPPRRKQSVDVRICCGGQLDQRSA